MASTKTDMSRGTNSQVAFSKVFSVKQSNTKTPDSDINFLIYEQQSGARKLHVIVNPTSKRVVREVPFSVKQELQRSFYEQVNKLLE